MKFNGVPYLGKISGTRMDTDGELLYPVYCVTFDDGDYREYSFHEVMKYLQSYDPADDDNELLQIIPFFGSSRRHLAATGAEDTELTVPTSSKVASTASGSNVQQQQQHNRSSARVRVLRRPHNIDDMDISAILSSQNRKRLRSGMVARTRAYEKVLAL